MNRLPRGPVVTLLALVLALVIPSAVGSAEASRTPPPSPGHLPTFTPAQAKAVLAKAQRQLHGNRAHEGARGHLAPARGGDLTLTLRDLHLARAALTGADRRAANALLDRARVLSSEQAARTTAVTPKVRCDTRFCIHYLPSGPGSTTSTQVDRTLSVMEHVRTYETQTLGYRSPVSDAPAVPTPDNPDGRFDVFLDNLRPDGIYGYCATDDSEPVVDGHAPAYCVLDNDYANYGISPLYALQVTAAHEFFHAVQFAYDVGEDTWFMEGSATWVEDEVYDNINDNYQYLPWSPIRHPRTSLTYPADAYPYGSFVFFKYVSESRAVSQVRTFWEAADGSRTSVQALYATVGATDWARFFATFGSWNTLPAGSYSERADYPAPAWVWQKTLTQRSPSTGWRKTTIAHLGNAPARIVPGSTLPTSKRLLVEVDGPNRSVGTAALLQRRYADGRVTHTMIPLDASGNGRLLVAFNRKTLRVAAVILSNTGRSGPSRPFRMRASLR